MVPFNAIFAAYVVGVILHYLCGITACTGSESLEDAGSAGWSGRTAAAL